MPSSEFLLLQREKLISLRSSHQDRARDGGSRTVIERSKNSIRQITAALHRINNGAYGICIDCQEKIPIKRLEMVPHTSRCAHCQEMFEINMPQDRSHSSESPEKVLR